MAKVFYPLGNLTRLVDATCGPNAHPDETKYRIAIGTEIWNEGNPLVLKIQMVYKDTGIQGRRSPSFPLGSDDFCRVQAAATELLQAAAESGLRGNVRT